LKRGRVPVATLIKAYLRSNQTHLAMRAGRPCLGDLYISRTSQHMNN